MFKVTKTDAVNNSTSSRDLVGPTDDDYDKTIAKNLFDECKPSREMSDYAEELCEDSDEDPKNAGLAREIVNGENFLLHGEMTIADEDDQSSQKSEESKQKSSLPRQNPLLSLHRNRLAARVIEESMAEASDVVERKPVERVQERVPVHRATPAISRRKSFGSKAPKQPPKPSLVDLTVPSHHVIKKPQNKSPFVYSPTTYSRARALMEPEPALQVRPSCHYYGTKRMQNQGGPNPPTKQITQPSPKQRALPSPKQTSQQPSPLKSRQLSASPLTKRSPSSSVPDPKPSSNPHRVITIEPDSTSSQGPTKSTKSSSSSGRGSKERAGLSLLDDDVFEYTPTPPTSSSNYEKLVKNEDRYSKYELGKMANDRHKKLFHKTAELNEKLKEIKDLEKKMSRMKGGNTKLSNELKEKNRILEMQSTELLDLEGSKSDCEIFINKLKNDSDDYQKELEVKIQEVESVNKRFHQTEKLLEEQRRLHQNLSLAHGTTLQKIRDMVEERKKTDLLHTAQIQDKDVLIRKLEIGLAQKMETVNDLLKDKKLLEGILAKRRWNEMSVHFKTPATVGADVKSPDEDDTIPDNLDSSQDSLTMEEAETPNNPPKRGRPVKRGISVKKLTTMSPRSRGRPLGSFGRSKGPLRKRVATRSRNVVNVDSDSTEPSPLAAKSPSLAATSPNPTTPRTRVKSAVSNMKRARSLTTSGKKAAVVPKRSKSEVQPVSETEVSGKRKRKPASRYSPSEEKMVPITDSPVFPSVEADPEPLIQQSTDNSTVSVEEQQVEIPTEKSTDKATDMPCDKTTESHILPDKLSDRPTDADIPPETSEEPAETDSDIKHTAKEVVPIVMERSTKVHVEYNKFMITAIEYKSGEPAPSKQEVDTATQKRHEVARNIEVPSFREMSPVMLIHQEGEQASVFSKIKETDTLANYTRMHKKCETAEIRMMKQCERMRLQLEQRNNRKKLKEPQKTPSIIRELHCRATDHSMSVTKCKHPCVSVFRCPLSIIKQRDFTLPWAKEITSFAYYAKSSSSRSAPDPAVTLNPGAPQVVPQPSTIVEPTSKTQITLSFSQSEDGIVVKKDETDVKLANLTVAPSVVSPGTEQPVNSAVKSTNIWSNIQTTANIRNILDNGLSKNIFSKFGELRKTSSSGESSSKDADTVNCKRERSSTDSNEQSPPKLPKIGVERRNLWESWCNTARTQTAPDQPSSSSFTHPATVADSQTTANFGTVQNGPDSSDETLSDSEISSEGFDQKSFLLDACSSKERSPTMPPQPLTRKLEKLSKHKRPVLVCTNSSNSSPRPSDDSFESSPAKT